MEDRLDGRSSHIIIPESVTAVALNVSHSMGEVVGSLSSSVGSIVHSVSSEVQRMVTTPPQTLNFDSNTQTSEESPGIYSSTPNITRISHPSPGSESMFSDTSNVDCESLQEMQAAIDIEIGIKEDYFEKPELNEKEMPKENLEEAILKCKNLILSCEENSFRRRALVHRLVKLRLSLQRLKEEEEVSETGTQIVKGHHLVSKHPTFTLTSKFYCDQCAHIIWGVIHVSYVCILCQFRCHGRCSKGIRRECATVRMNENPNYVLDICPEVGLSKQDYRCAECGTIITNKTAWSEPRRCDYNGKYYCPACHWNSRVIMPSRVIHNWDFEERSVSRQAKQLLQVMAIKPILDVEQLNPHLFRFVEELNLIKKSREDIIIMKKYLQTCRVAQENRLLLQLEERQHFVDNDKMYSLQDLIDINSGILIHYLNKIHSIFSSHIKMDCLICKGKGFICEVCNSNTTIYPFEPDVSTCQDCSTVYHKLCFEQPNFNCPRCIRQKVRKLKMASSAEKDEGL